MPPSIGPREQAATHSAAMQALRADMGCHLGTLVIVVDGHVARLLDITEDRGVWRVASRVPVTP